MIKSNMEEKMKKISILGATGSIGTQTLDVIRKSEGKIKLIGITANSSVEKIIEIKRLSREQIKQVKNQLKQQKLEQKNKVKDVSLSKADKVAKKQQIRDCIKLTETYAKI